MAPAIAAHPGETVSSTGRRRVVRPDHLVGAPLRLVLALVVVGALAPGMPAASDRAGRLDRWACVDAARALAPTPAPAVVQTGRARLWSRSATTGHGSCAVNRPFSAGTSDALVAAAPPGPLRATPSLVRRRGPPQPTS